MVVVTAELGSNIAKKNLQNSSVSVPYGQLCAGWPIPRVQNWRILAFLHYTQLKHGHLPIQTDSQYAVPTDVNQYILPTPRLWQAAGGDRRDRQMDRHLTIT